MVAVISTTILMAALAIILCNSADRQKPILSIMSTASQNAIWQTVTALTR